MALSVVLVGSMLPGLAVAANISIGNPLPTSSVGSQHDADMTWTTDRTVDGFFACNRWVVQPATPGSNTLGDGLAGNPWQSIKYAVSQARPGNNVCVAGGNYYENHFVPTASGTFAQPITFRSTGEIKLYPDTSAAEVNKPVFDFTASSPATKLEYWAFDRFPMDRQQQDGAGFAFQGLGGPVNHIIVQNTEIANSKASSGILLRGQVSDVMLRANVFKNSQRWQPDSAGPTDPADYTQVGSDRRRDYNGIEIEGTNPGSGLASVQRILIDNNTFTNLGGDGVQCLGVADDGPAQTGDPIDIDIVDNKVLNDATSLANQPITENAFDIKSCQYVSIRGRQPASGAPTGSKMKEFKSTAKGRDGFGGGNSDNGVAISVHYKARNVLIENNRIWNTCSGIGVGQLNHQVQNIVIRRNLMFGLRYHETAIGGTTTGSPNDAERCRGYGISVTNAIHADIYNNTLDGVPTTGLYVGQDDSDGNGTPDAGYSGIPTDIDIWNNVINLSSTVGIETRRWIRLGVAGGTMGTDVDSDYNLFWRNGGATASENRFTIGSSALNLTSWRTNRDFSRSAALVVADPQFVTDPTNNDYYTVSGSPARNGGLFTTGAAFCSTSPDIGFLESDCP